MSKIWGSLPCTIEHINQIIANRFEVKVPIAVQLNGGRMLNISREGEVLGREFELDPVETSTFFENRSISVEEEYYSLSPFPEFAEGVDNPFFAGLGPSETRRSRSRQVSRESDLADVPEEEENRVRELDEEYSSHTPDESFPSLSFKPSSAQKLDSNSREVDERSGP